MKSQRRNTSSSKDREWITGMHAVAAVLEARRRNCGTFYCADRDRLSPQLVEKINAHHIPIQEISARECERRGIEMRGIEMPQGVALEASRYPYIAFDELLQGDKISFLLALDQVQDPQNCGALLRTAYALGAGGVILSRDHSASVTPAVVRASAGASEFLKIAQVSGLPQHLSVLKKRGLWVVGADMNGEPIPECKVLGEPLVLVLGGEGKGLRQTTRTACDVCVRIPMHMNTVIDSLNVSVSGAIMMWEIAKNRLVR